MGLKKLILNIVLKIAYPFSLLQKVRKDTILFVSLEDDTLRGDFKLLVNELKKSNCKIELNLVKFEKTLKGNFLYFINCIKQLFMINRSGVVVIDFNNYVISNFKRKEVKAVQIWHASGAIKKFGNVIEREYPIKNYDYVISTSDVWKKPFSDAFGVKEEDVKVLGLPRCDALFQKETMKRYREEMLEKYPMCKNKKVILYAPTFRGNIYKGFSYQMLDLKRLKEIIKDDYVILYKFHPLLKSEYEKEIGINCNDEVLRKLFSITDILISDYSSLIFDFSTQHKSFVFYTPDLDEYRKTLGLFIDYEKEMPGPICFDVESVGKEILNIKENDKTNAFSNKYFKYHDDLSTKRVSEFLLSLLEF